MALSLPEENTPLCLHDKPFKKKWIMEDNILYNPVIAV
jgi:hypothetical protein